MDKRYKTPADPLDFKCLSVWLDAACSEARGKDAERIRTEAQSMLMSYCGRIEFLFCYAQPTDGSAEEEKKRIDATKQLLQLYRLTRVGKVRTPEEFERQKALVQRRRDVLAEVGQTTLECRLQNFIGGLAQQVFLSEDPSETLAFILHGKTKRGAKKKNDYRDFMIASDVAWLMHGGSKLDYACDEVAEQTRMESESIKNIYHRRQRDEVKAEVGLRALRVKQSL